ncbi:glycosyltransferase family 8 protein [Peribacillus sp. SCS-155]|uniref:glycosyltransferase family 8 protein n=1 Tax=Peribacillus sedimenti TaxID=3115297 RepID=UPI0039065FCC
METIHVVAATNDDYALHLAVMLNSLLENKFSENPIQIYILDGGNLSVDSKAKLEKSLQRFDVKPQFILVDASLYSGCLINRYYSMEMYFRLSIPDLLDHGIQKALYLDCDLIIEEDITILWNNNIDDYVVGAVFDPNELRREQLSIPKEYGYFNSGVLLININKWTENDILEKVKQFISDHPSALKYPDQDALNVILHDKWLRLEDKWNVRANRLNKTDIILAIIHFTGKTKPWNGKPPGKSAYLKYLDNTQW